MKIKKITLCLILLSAYCQHVYAVEGVDTTSFFTSVRTELDNMSAVCKTFFLEQTALSFGGITHSIKKGWHMLIGKKNNMCEAARQDYLLRMQVYLLDKVKHFCKIVGGGIPSYENFLEQDFLKTIGLDNDGTIKFLPQNVYEHSEYNELVNFIFRLRFNFFDAKDDPNNYINYLGALIRFYERRKGDDPIPTMPEKIEDEEKENQACDNPSRRSLAPNSILKNKADMHATSISTSSPFSPSSPIYKGNFYQLPILTMVPKNSAKESWQLCSCAFIPDLSSNSSFGKDRSSGKSGLESFINDVKNVIEKISSPTKIMQQLQLGWEHLKRLLYTSIGSITKKVSEISLKKMAEQYTSKSQKSWNDNVSKKLNDLKESITSTYEKNGAFGVLGKFINAKISVNIKTNFKFSSFLYNDQQRRDPPSISYVLKSNQRMRSINNFQEEINKKINEDVIENLNTLDEENFFAKVFNYLQVNIRYYIPNFVQAVFVTNKIDGYMDDHTNYPPNYEEYRDYSQQ